MSENQFPILNTDILMMGDYLLIVSIIVQMYYAYRIYVISGSKYMASSIIVVSYIIISKQCSSSSSMQKCAYRYLYSKEYLQLLQVLRQNKQFYSRY